MSDETSARLTDSEPATIPPSSRPTSYEPGPGARRMGYIVSIAVNLVLLYLANGVPNWNVPFITNEWPDVLWAVNLSLGATIVANLLFLAFDPWWFRRGAQIGLNVLAIVVFYALYRVFPFDLGRALYEQVARWGLLALIMATAIAIVVEFVKLILGRER
jgi:hypothetical protein